MIDLVIAILLVGEIMVCVAALRQRRAIVTLATLGICIPAIVLTLALAAHRAEGYWRAHLVRQFVSQSLADIQDGQLPRLTPDIREADLDALRRAAKTASTSNYEIVFEDAGYGYYQMLVTFGDGQAFWCCVDDPEASRGYLLHFPAARFHISAFKPLPQRVRPFPSDATAEFPNSEK